MAAIIEELRGLTEAGTAEYQVGTTWYWQDAALQDVLDSHRQDLTHFPLQSYPVVASGGTLQYYDYRLPHGFLEATSGGSSVFYLQDGTGAALGTALWSMDYRSGQVTFAANTLGSALYATGRAYDLNAAAGDVWRRKAAHYAPTAFNFSTDNHSISREQVYTHCIEMSAFFNGISGDAIQTVDRFRSDLA
jgi:hypothetical protein